MDTVRICWQAVPGGRPECTAPMTRDTAEFRLRDQRALCPAIRYWIDELGDTLASDDAESR